MNIIFDRPKSDDQSFFSVSKNNLVMKVPPLLTSRVIYEGLSVDSIIQIFEDSLTKGPSKEKFVFYGFDKEKFLWD